MSAVMGTHRKGSKIIKVTSCRCAQRLLFRCRIPGINAAGKDLLRNIIDFHVVSPFEKTNCLAIISSLRCKNTVEKFKIIILLSFVVPFVTSGRKDIPTVTFFIRYQRSSLTRAAAHDDKHIHPLAAFWTFHFRQAGCVLSFMASIKQHFQNSFSPSEND